MTRIFFHQMENQTWKCPLMWKNSFAIIKETAYALVCKAEGNYIHENLKSSGSSSSSSNYVLLSDSILCKAIALLFWRKGPRLVFLKQGTVNNFLDKKFEKLGSKSSSTLDITIKCGCAWNFSKRAHACKNEAAMFERACEKLVATHILKLHLGYHLILSQCC